VYVDERVYDCWRVSRLCMWMSVCMTVGEFLDWVLTNHNIVHLCISGISHPYTLNL